MRRREVLGQVISGIALQFTNAILSLIKVPILIHGLGSNQYLRIAVIISFWSYISFMGEVNRRNARISYVENQELILIKRDYLTGIIGILVTILLLFNPDQLNHWKESITSMVMMIICGYIYSKNACVIGFLEATGRISYVNLLQIVSQILIFPFFLLAANYGNSFLTLLTFLLSFVGGSTLVHFFNYSKMKNRKFSSAVTESRIWKEITLWEMVPTSLFPLIISLVCTKSELLKFLVYQKFSITFAIIPVALGPFYSMLDFQMNKKLIKKFIWAINCTFLGLLVVILSVYEESIIGFISHRQVNSSPIFFYSVLISGMLGVFFSQFQNSASYGKKIKARVYALRIHQPIAILILVITGSIYGSYFGFLVSAYISLLINITIRMKLKIFS